MTWVPVLEMSCGIQLGPAAIKISPVVFNAINDDESGDSLEHSAGGVEQPVAALELVSAHRLGQKPVGPFLLTMIPVRQPGIRREIGPEDLNRVGGHHQPRMARMDPGENVRAGQLGSVAGAGRYHNRDAGGQDDAERQG